MVAVFIGVIRINHKILISFRMKIQQVWLANLQSDRVSSHILWAFALWPVFVFNTHNIPIVTCTSSKPNRLYCLTLFRTHAAKSQLQCSTTSEHAIGSYTFRLGKSN